MHGGADWGTALQAVMPDRKMKELKPRKVRTRPQAESGGKAPEGEAVGSDGPAAAAGGGGGKPHRGCGIS